MSNPPRDETVPEWLSINFMETALKKSFKNDDLKIFDCKIKVATAVGENYSSQLLRYNLVIKTDKDKNSENISVLVKLKTQGKLAERLDKSQAYDKEEQAYASILPVINDLLNDAYPDHKKLWPDCYFHQKLPNYILILEDLSLRGFTLANRFEGFDMEHTKYVLKSLAKLHAASLVIQKENPEKLKMYLKNCWEPKYKENTTFTATIKIMSEDILEWEECEKREIYSKKLKALENNILQKIHSIWEVNESKLNVLLHGDSWANNFMFKYDPNGKLTEINFVDFQLMNVNSPCMDLQYFIFTSVNPNIRFDCIEIFLQTYYETFIDALKRLKHQLDFSYSFEQFKKEFEEKYFWGLTVLCGIFPLILIPSKEAFHLNEFWETKNNGNFEKIYKRKSLRDVLIKGLKFFDEKGVF